MDVELTELEKLEVTRVDAVGRPANGFPVLLMKGITPEPADEPAVKDADDMVNCPTCKGDGKIMGGKRDCPDCDNGKVTPAKAKTLAAKEIVKAIVGRKVDESPDIAGGTAVLAQIADLIIAEAQELKSGVAGEISDIQQLACAAEMIWCWRTGEESVASGSVMPATTLMQSAAEDDVEKGGPSQDERRKAADEGNALPDGSYPIRDAHELHSAAVLARSGHGDAAAAKKLIARRAKELGVANPLDNDSDTSKSQIADEGTTVDTVTQTGELTELVKDAVAKAMAPLEERIKVLNAEVAKANALPVLGGPVMSAVRPGIGQGSEDHAAKARYFDEWAERVSDPSLVGNYRQLAAQERAKITS